MNDHNKILDAWIMMEHLSEGYIKLKEKEYKRFDDFDDAHDNYYDYFKKKLPDEAIKDKYKEGGLIVYVDIFSIQRLVDFLREEFNLEASDEETKSSHVFSCALYFDIDLKFVPEKLFFTEPAFILQKHIIPDKKAFEEYEDDLKDKLSKEFDTDDEYKDVFNRTLESIISRYAFKTQSLSDCRYQIVKKFDDVNNTLHSFYISDLEMAKSVKSENLNRYLDATCSCNIRNNLDCRKKEERQLFTEILNPENYPMGRFPSNTEYALSFMQQVAVNLVVSYKDQKLRSVNGPPGTGKTTLLKDVFADLIVKQAKFIVDNHDEQLLEAAPCRIEVLPKALTMNSILVLSSNNTAVQNIVNELPLVNGISEDLKEELQNVDYFKKVANSKEEKGWFEEGGKRKSKLKIEEDNTGDSWGLFSLEGGKQANLEKILNKLEHVKGILDSDEFVSDKDAYDEFNKQYAKVKELRKQPLDKKTKLEALNKKMVELQESKMEIPNKEKEKDQLKKRLEIEIPQLQNAYKELELGIKNNTEEINEIEDSLDKLGFLIKELNAQKVHFWEFSRKKEKENNLKELIDSYKNKLTDKSDLIKKKRNLERQRDKIEVDLNNKLSEFQKADTKFSSWVNELNDEIEKIEIERGEINIENELDLGQEYDKLQNSNPWFDKQFRIEQSKLFILALRVRKQFIYEKRKNIQKACMVWNKQDGEFSGQKEAILVAWNWINFVVPVISSTFASFSRMMRNINENSLGYVFVDEAGQAVPQAVVGAIFRSTNLMVVGDPAQIKPVLTLDSKVLGLLSEHYGVGDKYISDSASVQTLVDSAGEYGFYKEEDRNSWIGIPLWVHRRCEYPMFSISNKISYNDCMVQGNKANGKARWFNVKGKANNKYVTEQGDFLIKKIQEMADDNPDILNHDADDQIYVISPFKNVADVLAKRLDDIDFTRRKDGKPTNVGTVHTFQGKEAPIVFFVLGADRESERAARWAVAEANIMNVAATRAKKEFFIIGDLSLYMSIDTKVINDTLYVLNEFNARNSELEAEK